MPSLWFPTDWQQRLAELQAPTGELKEAPLHRDSRSLGVLLGEALREQAGLPLYEAVEDLRRTAIARAKPTPPPTKSPHPRTPTLHWPSSIWDTRSAASRRSPATPPTSLRAPSPWQSVSAPSPASEQAPSTPAAPLRHSSAHPALRRCSSSSRSVTQSQTNPAPAGEYRGCAKLTNPKQIDKEARMAEHRILQEGKFLNFTCKNSQFRTNIKLGKPHGDKSKAKGSVFKGPLADDGRNTLWLEHVTNDGHERFYWLMWYCNGEPAIPMSGVLHKDDLPKIGEMLASVVD
jgi:hypothetical protein